MMKEASNPHMRSSRILSSPLLALPGPVPPLFFGQFPRIHFAKIGDIVPVRSEFSEMDW